MIAACLAAAGCRTVLTGRLDVPPGTKWAVSASESAEGHPPEHALDGRLDTEWRSGAGEPQWIQVDFGQAAMVGGVSLHWGEPPATAYAVHTSLDGVHWALGAEVADGDGGWTQRWFEPLLARHVRVQIVRGLQGGGAALRSLDVLGVADRPQLLVDGVPAPEAMAILDGDPFTFWRSPNPSAVLDVDLRRVHDIGSVRIDWGPGGLASNVMVNLSTNGVDWFSAGRLQARAGDFDVLMGDRVQSARHLRLTFEGASRPEGFEVARLVLRGAEGVARPWGMYEVAAAQAPPGVYPEVFQHRQTYWTVAAGPDPDDAEGLLDEWGVFAPGPHSPILQPLLLTGDGPLSARQAQTLEHRLAGDGAPMPETVWRMPSGLSLRIRAMSRTGAAPPMSWVAYELANDSLMVQTGRLAWVVRPVCLPPPWAGGGLSPVYRIRRTVTPDGWQELWLNGRRVYAVPDANLAFGAAAFDGGDMASLLARGDRLSSRATVRDEEGLASAAWWTDYQLEPGESVRMVVAALAPGGNDSAARRFSWPEAEGGADRLADVFDQSWSEARWNWRSKTDRLSPRIAAPDAMDALQAQVGLLIGVRDSADGGAGDGTETLALRVAALLRAGKPAAARSWVELVARGMATDGWVPAAFQPDGTPVSRIGSEGVHGSQGQLAFMVMETYRFTKDSVFLHEHYPAARNAMAYLQRLRADLEKTEGRLPLDERERLEGLLPLSPARPGAAAPAHFYADQYWALLGWKEVRDAASVLGLDHEVAWADEHYRRLKAAVRRSLRAQMDRYDILWLPATANDDRFDPRAVALLFWPCDETDLVEPHERQTSLDLFYTDFLRRGADGKAAPHIPSDDFMMLLPLAMMGRGDYAREVLQANLVRRQPPGWHAWPDQAGLDPRHPGVTGWMPDLRAAAAYVIAVRGLIARETERRLDLFSGIPPEWLQYGHGLRVYSMPTAHGPLDVSGVWHGHRLTVEIGGAARPPGGYRIWWPRQIAPERVLANGRHVDEFDAFSVQLPHDFSGRVEAVFPFRAPWPREPGEMPRKTRAMRP